MLTRPQVLNRTVLVNTKQPAMAHCECLSSCIYCYSHKRECNPRGRNSTRAWHEVVAFHHYYVLIVAGVCGRSSVVGILGTETTAHSEAPTEPRSQKSITGRRKRKVSAGVCVGGGKLLKTIHYGWVFAVSLV